jgi:hypothetical protein
MAQSDQVVQNTTFPTVRADINDNLAALYSQNSGNSAPAVTVAFQPWVDTSSSPPVWKVRNGSNTAWITIGVLDPAGFNAGGVTAIANGGTGATTAALALAALLPSQSGNAGKALVTSGSAASWGVVASGASIQVFTATGTYTPTAGKTTFLIMATGGGGGGGGSGTGSNGNFGSGGGGGAGGTGWRLYTSTEMGGSATVTVGAGGAAGGFNTSGGAGGTTSFAPTGTGLTLSGLNGGGGGGAYSISGQSISGGGGAGGSATNAQFSVTAQSGNVIATRSQGWSFFIRGTGCGGTGGVATTNTGVSAGIQGNVVILEW